MDWLVSYGFCNLPFGARLTITPGQKWLGRWIDMGRFDALGELLILLYVAIWRSPPPYTPEAYLCLPGSLIGPSFRQGNVQAFVS